MTFSISCLLVDKKAEIKAWYLQNPGASVIMYGLTVISTQLSNIVVKIWILLIILFENARWS